ncbi:ATP-binding cassette (ABC) Superfamily [Phytophthora palmivora]|uniref:ATP-binding cassette (ABC) Superfamily n=1 Tax=Phytophthora palmivora TaxID=4796 RepID=A0A2P4YQC2_9STRA|nr:ATP-binding cassette (ABC) Superfamily [Phytophthora palmivora]POM79999.1 ATP-binding cassette (ABC) Superfamily [Phytophthora palmivora]
MKRRGLSQSPKRSPTISMSSRSAIKPLNSKVLLRLPRRCIHGYYPPDAGSGSPMFLEHLKAPRGLNHGRTSRGAYGRALVQDEPLFVNDIEAARCVLLAPHRIPLKEFTSLRKNRKTVPENTTTQTQADDLFWRWVSLKNFTV